MGLKKSPTVTCKSRISNDGRFSKPANDDILLPAFTNNQNVDFSIGKVGKYVAQYVHQANEAVTEWVN